MYAILHEATQQGRAVDDARCERNGLHAHHMDLCIADLDVRRVYWSDIIGVLVVAGTPGPR